MLTISDVVLCNTEVLRYRRSQILDYNSARLPSSAKAEHGERSGAEFKSLSVALHRITENDISSRLVKRAVEMDFV